MWRRNQKTASAGMAPKASSRRHMRSTDIPVARSPIASSGAITSPAPCMANTSDTIRPRSLRLAYLAIALRVERGPGFSRRHHWDLPYR